MSVFFTGRPLGVYLITYILTSGLPLHPLHFINLFITDFKKVLRFIWGPSPFGTSLRLFRVVLVQ